MNENQNKEPAPDPEIPDELRNKLSKPKRPASFTPKSEAAEDDNAPAEALTPAYKPKDLTAFWPQLSSVIRGGKFYRTITEMRERKTRDPITKKWKLVREATDIEEEVKLTEGADGLPYTVDGVDAEETRRIRSLNYPDAPKMDLTDGDLTEEFVEWLYLNHPYDAAVRYYSRLNHVQKAAIDRTS